MLRHDLVHLREVPEIGQVDGELGNVGEGCAGGAYHRAEVFEDLLDLRVDVVRYELHRRRVERDLAG